MSSNLERIQEIQERLEILNDFGHKTHRPGQLTAERELLLDELDFLQGQVPSWLMVEGVWEDGSI